MKKYWMILIACFVVACGSDTTNDDTKPTVDPDAQFVGDRADGLSNHFTTIKGSVDVMDQVNGSIDYPDYFHGYTIQLEEGQKMLFAVDTTASSIVRLYGPARNSNPDRPRFGRATVKANTKFDIHGNRHVSDIEYTAEESGLYMLVLGPKFVWSADYIIKFRLIRDGECTSDVECGAGEACVDNGVRCITAPCYANYNICEPVDPNGCEDHDDCSDDSWCRWSDWDGDDKTCVPFVGEGESCGGFAPPQYINACSPELSCVYRPFIADAPGACRNVVTVKDLQASPDKYVGQRVHVTGYIQASYAICTQMACSPENACCNSCGASMLLSDDASTPMGNGMELVGQDGSSYHCGGNNCNYMDNCTTDAGNYQVLGTVEVTQFGVKFHVESATSLDSIR